MDLKIDTLVSCEDYLQFSGINLNIELAALANNDIGDNPAPRFIRGIEEFLKDYYCSPPYLWDGTFKSNFQRENFKKAVLYQIQYELQNGSVINFSGFDGTSGTVMSRAVMEQIGVAPMAHKCMRSGGMANLWR